MPQISSIDTITGMLGQGTFGKVVEVYDHILKKNCAVKVIKSQKKYEDAAKLEITVLKGIKKHDPSNTKFE